MTRAITDQDLERTLRVRSAMQDPTGPAAPQPEGDSVMKEQRNMGVEVAAKRVSDEVTAAARERRSTEVSEPPKPEPDPVERLMDPKTYLHE